MFLDPRGSEIRQKGSGSTVLAAVSSKGHKEKKRCYFIKECTLAHPEALRTPLSISLSRLRRVRIPPGVLPDISAHL